MADEAVLRIVLDDKSKGTGGPSTGGDGGPNTGAGTGGNTAGGTSNTGGGSSFDPVAEAQKRFEVDRRRAAIDVEYAKLRPVKQPFDPADEARKRFEKDKQRAEIDAEYAKLVPPPTNPPFDPVAEAQKRLDKDKQRAAIDAEYAKLKPEPPFDPSEEARKRREGERRRAQIDAAYKEQYGDDEKETGLDQVLKVADSLRGTLGGVFGSAVGAVLDMVSGVRKAQVTAAKEQRDKDLLAEAQETTKAVKSVTKPATLPEETKAALQTPVNKDTHLAPQGKTTQLTPQTDTPQPSASDIANKFKIPKAGSGTATGARSTTQAADIAKTAAKEHRDKDLLSEAQETTKAVKSVTKPTPPSTETKAAAEDTTPLANSAGAANIANKFKVPKAGFGTATGAKSTTQAADIAKLGTNVGEDAGTAEAASGAASGGAMEGLVAAAGPIALAVVAADAIQKAVISAVKDAVSTVGDVVTAIASPNADPSVPIAQLGDVVSKTGEKLGILGIGAVVAGESLKALSSVMQALDATAQRYAEYSAPISQALAVAEVNQTMGDLHRAQEISPEMVRYIQAQSDLQQKVEDVKIRLLTKIMPVVTRVVQILEVMMTGGENIVKGIELLALPLTQMTKIFGDWFGWEQDSDKEPPEDPTTILFDPRFEQGGLGTPRSPGFVPDA